MIYFSYPFQQDWSFLNDQSKIENAHVFHEMSAYLLLEMKNAFNFNENRPLTIINTLIDCPQYFEEANLVFVTVKDGAWANQSTYQLAHEMCHYFIGSGIKSDNLKWFEESLCDLSSHFFLQNLSSKWAVSQNPMQIGNKSLYMSYSEEALTHKEPFILAPDITYDRYDRNKNTYIASLLLPIFNENPKLWTEIPKLADIQADIILELLTKWFNSVEASNQHSVKKIINLFNTAY